MLDSWTPSVFRLHGRDDSVYLFFFSLIPSIPFQFHGLKSRQVQITLEPCHEMLQLHPTPEFISTGNSILILTRLWIFGLL